jgi:gluconate:H+ symporter, GntP family
LLLMHTGIAIVGVIVLIVALKIHPVYSLLAGILYLGIAGGLGLSGTLDALTGGFGDIIAKIGLLIAFGVTMGTAMSELGAIDRIVSGLLRIFGERRAPYALGITTGTALQAIFADVMLIVTAPIARGLARQGGTYGIPKVVSAIVPGILVGLTMMVPSVGSLALAGVIEIPLWRYLVFGTIACVITIVATIALMNLLIERTRFWNPATDEDREAFDKLDQVDGDVNERGPERGSLSSDHVAQTATPTSSRRHRIPLALAVAPVLTSLVLIAAGTITDVFGVKNSLLSFVSDPTIALLVGSFGAMTLVRIYRGLAGVKRSLDSAFSNLGEVLVLTGLGGALAGLVKATGLSDVLGELFTHSAGPPILLAWLIACVLHVAIGSVSLASITAAGILGPVAATSGMDPLLIALAAASGSLFLMTVHSNFFWVAKNLLGQTTKGAVKAVGVSTSVASLIGLAVTLGLSLVL